MLATQTATLPVDPAHTQILEKNAATINGGGMTATASGVRNAWATGSLQAWASGIRNAWATGKFTPVPENTGIWEQVGLEQAQLYAPHLGGGIKVAIIDTGIDSNHIAFQGALAPRDEWRDFYGDDNDPTDEGVFGEGGYGHGTNTAGIVLQIAPKAIILPIRALGPDGGADVLTIARAIDYAVKKKSRIINLSLGSTERSDAITKAIARATAAGVVVTESAGNEGKERLNYPAADAHNLGVVGNMTVSVGSVNAKDIKSVFSNYGKSLELVTPGESVFGPAPGQTNGNWNMAAWSGTSMSAPMAAGALALAMGENDHMIAGLFRGSATFVAGLTASSADSLYELTGNKLYQGKLGDGRLDIGRLLRWVTFGF
jgi:thermitase